MFAVMPVSAGHKFIDRGDPDDNDWVTINLTLNGEWHDLDLSSIIPKNAVLVLLRISNRDDVVGVYFDVREKGNSYQRNFASVHTFVVNKYNNQDVLVVPNKDGIIEYKGTEGTATAGSIVVGGWWI